MPPRSGPAPPKQVRHRGRGSLGATRCPGALAGSERISSRGPEVNESVRVEQSDCRQRAGDHVSGHRGQAKIVAARIHTQQFEGLVDSHSARKGVGQFDEGSGQPNFSLGVRHHAAAASSQLGRMLAPLGQPVVPHRTNGETVTASEGVLDRISGIASPASSESIVRPVIPTVTG
jgi:hypothetical protein